MPILVKNDTWTDMKDKLREEVQEVLDATDVENRTEEIWDVIQVCHGMLDKTEKEYPGLAAQKYIDHIIKLKNRGWEFKDELG